MEDLLCYEVQQQKLESVNQKATKRWKMKFTMIQVQIYKKNNSN